MWRVLATMRQNLQNIRKSPRVADESMVNNIGGGNNLAEVPIFAHHDDDRHMNRRMRSPSSGWIKGFSVVYSVVILPFSLFSCFSDQPPHVHGAADGVWASAEFAQMTEMNHLMGTDTVSAHEIPTSCSKCRHLGILCADIMSA